jgi:predicted kinase
MDAIIFIGIQGSGKSTFYKDFFFNSHLRISLDLLNTRNKENQFIDKCIELHQKLVIDNTNPTIEERKKYIEKLKANKYKVIGYFFQSKIKDSLERNDKRTGKNKVSEVGILSTYKKMELPATSEGFDELYYVEISDNSFIIKPWQDEI